MFSRAKEISSKMNDLTLEVFQSHLVTSNKTYKYQYQGMKMLEINYFKN